MTKKVLYIVLLTLTSLQSFAQGHNNNWIWHHNSLSFNTIPPSSPSWSSSVANYTPALTSSPVVISSSTGNLLFYSDGYKIKDASHNIMPHGNFLPTFNMGRSKQDAVIVPDPANSNRYYLFQAVSIPYSYPYVSNLYYSVIDMTLNGGLGDVVTTSNNVLLATNISSPLTAIKQIGTNNFWILSCFNNGFKTFLLTTNGVNSAPVTSIIGPQNNLVGNLITMKANPQGTKVSRTYPSVHSIGSLITDSTELYDFNANTGTFSNFQLLTSGLFYYNNTNYMNAGIEFSMNGNVLYRVHNQGTLNTNKDTIIQYDLTNNNSKTFIPIVCPLQSSNISDIQLAPNGKIYIMNDTAINSIISTISVIDQPNVLGLGCNYLYGSQSLNNSNNINNAYSFPNLVPSLMGSFAPYLDSQYSDNVAYTTASLHARISFDGNSPITQRGFYYGTSPIPQAYQVFLPGTSGPFIANLTGLTPNTLYYYRAFATNANGTTILYDSTFHTLKPNVAPYIKFTHNKETCVSDTMRFVVIDEETSPANTTVTFTSSNTSLLPLSSMAISGADTNKVLSFSPIPYQSGTSLITITATDSNGASTTQSFSIIVAPGAPISIIALNNIIACSGDSVLLQCAIPQGTTINWYVNAIASGIGTAQYATTQSASIYAVCTNAQGCATKSNTINATVKPTPQVQCTINGPATICVGDSVQLQALSTAGYSYQWFKNTQLLPNANSAIYYAKQSGDYSYVATLNGCSKTSNAQTIKVVPAPIASITTPNTTVICNGQGALLQATTGTGYTYQWTMNGFDIAGATNPTYTATIGSYYTAVSYTHLTLPTKRIV